MAGTEDTELCPHDGISALIRREHLLSIAVIGGHRKVMAYETEGGLSDFLV